MSEFAGFLIAWIIATVISAIIIMLDLEWYWNVLAGTVSFLASWTAFCLTTAAPDAEKPPRR